MGGAVIDLLSEEEQEGMYRGMHTHGRDFYKIATEMVPGKTAGQLASYYYDVWKLRLVPTAVRWYADKAAKEAERLAEIEEEERRHEVEMARRAERAEATNKRRMTREAVQWVRSAAKTAPMDVNMNKTIVRERAVRVVNVLKKGFVIP
jgi:pyruvate-formate lyase